MTYDVPSRESRRFVNLLPRLLRPVNYKAFIDGRRIEGRRAWLGSNGDTIVSLLSDTYYTGYSLAISLGLLANFIS